MTLDEVRERLTAAAVLCDFDGVLAPIAARPEDARPLPEAAAVLSALLPRVRRLAVITGRPASFVREHLHVDGLVVAGLYGLEGDDPTPLDRAVWRAVASAATMEPGAELEDKGAGVAVHLRDAPDPDDAMGRLRALLAAIATGAGLVLVEGERVLELVPPGPRKGAAVRRLAADAEALLVAGDDLPDLEAFDAADELAASGLAVCRVVVGGPETPGELVGRADVLADGPRGFLDLLRSL